MTSAREPLDPAGLTFRPATRADFPLLHRWFHEAHAKEWYAKRGATLADVTAEYGPYIDGETPIHVYVVAHDSVPIGMMQWCRFGDFDFLMNDYQVTDRNACNCDVLIGEPAAAYRGLGAPMVLKFLREIVYVHADVTSCFIDPEAKNAIAIRVYQRAGFHFVRDVKDDDGTEVHLMEMSREEITSR